MQNNLLTIKRYTISNSSLITSSNLPLSDCKLVYDRTKISALLEPRLNSFIIQSILGLEKLVFIEFSYADYNNTFYTFLRDSTFEIYFGTILGTNDKFVFNNHLSNYWMKDKSAYLYAMNMALYEDIS